MRRVFKIVFRLSFIVMWFVIGWFPYRDVSMGLFSAICGFILMEIFYAVDKRTSGFDKIMGRLNYLDETLVESKKTRDLILEEISIAIENVEGRTNIAKGKREGLSDAYDIVKKRFNEVFEALKEKQSNGGENK